MNDRIDFGPDDDMPPMSDAEFDAWLTRVAPKLNAPSATPRGEMWKVIETAARTSSDAQAGRIPGVTPIRRHWRLLSLIAAALLIGVGVDRMALRREREQRVAATPAATVPARADSADPSGLYRLAAAQTFTQAEALLVAYRASDAPGRDPQDLRQLGSWGRQVLSSTRLLLDSPAGRDPQLRALLDDLELVLVQIIRHSGAPLDTTDRALIDRALQDSRLLPRIRTAVPSPIPADASSD
ncbi:MAG TPA: hypothetical protein VKH19_06465 [Gemmatimonadaceae bacterium]|nr:hypothetical protein [Gemmatimonadaceae bacterium]